MSVRDIESNEGMSCDISVSKPSRIRIAIAAVLVLMACLLYLDRFAVGIASEYIREDVRLTQTQMSWFLSVFFWAYALSQVPSGWLSDRFGKRLMLTVYILLWSVFTGWLGLTYEVWIILLLRLLCGAAQAGAFPVCGGLLRAWFPISQRGVASSIVALGGRTGGVLAPLLTAWLIIAFTSQQAVPDFNDSSFLDTKALVIRIHEASTSDHPKLELLRVLYESFPSELKQQVIHDAATLSAEQLTQPKLQNQTTGFRWRDIFQRDTKTLKGTQPESLPGVVQQLNLCLNDSKFVQTDRIKGVTLPKTGLQLLKKQQSGKELESKEYRLLNRLAIETALPQLVPRFYGRGWRPALITYGLIGIVVAFALAIVGRDSPNEHSWCNQSERDYINDDASKAAKLAEPPNAPFPWHAVLTSISLWGNSAMQFFTNIGWLFVVTWLPRYLDKVHGVPLSEQALMTAIPTAAGIVAMLCGGWWTDFSMRRAGLKWGRRIPLVSSRLLAAFGYCLCIVIGFTATPDPSSRWLPWMIVFALSIAVFGVDLGIPAVWAYAQDVGGKYTGAIFGWSNMWGNIGAAVAPLLYNAVLGETPELFHWNSLFALCAIAFVLSALTGLVLDASKPIEAKPDS